MDKSLFAFSLLNVGYASREYFINNLLLRVAILELAAKQEFFSTKQNESTFPLIDY